MKKVKKNKKVIKKKFECPRFPDMAVFRAKCPCPYKMIFNCKGEDGLD